MTTPCRIELECLICDNSIQSEAVVSTNAFGGKRTDFHEQAQVWKEFAPIASSATMTGSEK